MQGSRTARGFKHNSTNRYTLLPLLPERTARRRRSVENTPKLSSYQYLGLWYFRRHLVVFERVDDSCVIKRRNQSCDVGIVRIDRHSYLL